MIGGNFGPVYFSCVIGSVAFLIALILVDWMRSGRAFVIPLMSRYALAFGISLVLSPLIWIILIWIMVASIKR